MKTFKKISLLIILSFLSFAIFPQQKDDIMVSPTGDTITIKPISLFDISPRMGNFNSNIISYKNELNTSKEIYTIDTSVISARKYLDKGKLIIDESIKEMPLVKIDNSKREWSAYQKTLDNWETTITNRMATIEATLFKVQVSFKTWEATKQSAKDQAIPRELLGKIEETIIVARDLENELKHKQDSIILLQNSITGFKIIVNGVLNSIESRRKEIQAEYFEQDSSPLWKAGDSTLKLRNAKVQLKASLDEHKKSIEIFKLENSKNLKLLLLIFVILLLLFYFLNIDFNKHELTDDEKSRQIKYFLSRYFLSSFLLSLSISMFIFSNMPSAIRESAFLLMLIPTVILYNGIIPKVFRPLLILMVLLFFLDEMYVLIAAKSLLARIQMLLQDSLYIYIMIKLIQLDSSLGVLYKSGWLKAIKRGAKTLIVFSIISILANILGYVNLSIILSNTLTNAFIVPIALSLIVYILNALFVSLFKTKFFQHSNIIKSHGETISKKLHTLLIYLAIFGWIRSIFVSLGLSEEIGEWFRGLLSLKWKVGSVDISFGGIIAFFFVILITSVVTKGIKYLLEEEIFPRIKLGRGVPGAISMVVRYTLVAFGIYIALSAAGVDLGSFGLIAGALGVGIGFGLQGIVYNFIAGLILAFERPIQKGDTIQIGTVFGDVTEIGVRASKIQTYDGSTIIVPNGNLISNDLTNWTFSKRVRRREINVGVAYGSDPHKVMELLEKVASENENVLPYPKPWPIFEGFGDSSLNFKIRFWVNFDQGVTIQSDVAMNIYDALADAGIEIPFPQTDLHVRSFDPTVQKTIFPLSKEQLKKTPGRKPTKPKDTGDSK